MKSNIKFGDFLHWGTFAHIKCFECGKEERGKVRAVALNDKRICRECAKKWGLVVKDKV